MLYQSPQSQHRSLEWRITADIAGNNGLNDIVRCGDIFQGVRAEEESGGISFLSDFDLGTAVGYGGLNEFEGPTVCVGQGKPRQLAGGLGLIDAKASLAIDLAFRAFFVQIPR